MSVGKIPKFNVGDQLSGTIGLQHLHLVLQAGSGNCDLRQELQSKLPASLQRITVEASKMPALHPAALKVNYSCSSSSYLRFSSKCNNLGWSVSFSSLFQLLNSFLV